MISQKIKDLDDRRRERMTGNVPPLTSEAGEPILEKHEFSAIVELKAVGSDHNIE